MNKKITSSLLLIFIFALFLFSFIPPARADTYVSATGGTVTYISGYEIHTFIADGDFIVSAGGDVQVLMIGGGGGGGWSSGGGGGQEAWFTLQVIQ